MSALWSDRERLWRWADWLLALLLAALAQYEIWIQSLAEDGVPRPHAVHALFALLITLPLAWRRRAPLAVLCVVLGSAVVEGAAFANFPSFEPFLASVIAIYSVAAHCDRRRALVGAAVAYAALIPGELVRALSSDHSVDLGAVLVFTAAWVVGRTLRRWRLEAATQGQRARRLEREREEKARLAVAEERARIARELHDVVAHAVSVIVIQAQGAQRELEGEQPSVREALGSIESTGRQALVEMRRLLGILRRSDEELALAPQPSLKLLEHSATAAAASSTSPRSSAAPLPPTSPSTPRPSGG